MNSRDVILLTGTILTICAPVVFGSVSASGIHRDINSDPTATLGYGYRATYYRHVASANKNITDNKYYFELLFGDITHYRMLIGSSKETIGDQGGTMRSGQMWQSFSPSENIFRVTLGDENALAKVPPWIFVSGGAETTSDVSRLVFELPVGDNWRRTRELEAKGLAVVMDPATICGRRVQQVRVLKKSIYKNYAGYWDVWLDSAGNRLGVDDWIAGKSQIRERCLDWEAGSKIGEADLNITVPPQIPICRIVVDAWESGKTVEPMPSKFTLDTQGAPISTLRVEKTLEGAAESKSCPVGWIQIEQIAGPNGTELQRLVASEHGGVPVSKENGRFAIPEFLGLPQAEEYSWTKRIVATSDTEVDVTGQGELVKKVVWHDRKHGLLYSLNVGGLKIATDRLPELANSISRVSVNKP